MTAQRKPETWLPLCQLADLVPESGVATLVESEQIAVFYLPEQKRIYAIANRDPFSGANVIARGLVGDLQGKTVVASPLYKQHFCLETGQCLEDDSVRLTTWPVRIDDHRVLICKL